MANYLYNGIELPDINTVWTDKETYPYAFLGSDGVRTTLVITSMPAKVVPLYEGVVVPGTLYWHVIGLVKFFDLSNGSWGDAVDSAEFDDYVDVGIAGIVGGYEWSNHDILNADGSVYLAASDPVPVGGEPETSLTDYVIMPGADYKAACDAIRNKTGKTDLIKSGDMASEIANITTGGGSVDDGFLHVDFTANIANGTLALPSEVITYFQENGTYDDETYCVMLVTIPQVYWNGRDEGIILNLREDKVELYVVYHPASGMSVVQVTPCRFNTSIHNTTGVMNANGGVLSGAFNANNYTITLSGLWYYFEKDGNPIYWDKPMDLSANTDDVTCHVQCAVTKEI